MDLLVLIVLLLLAMVFIGPIMAYQAKQKVDRLQQQLALLQQEVTKLKQASFTQPSSTEQLIEPTLKQVNITSEPSRRNLETSNLNPPKSTDSTLPAYQTKAWEKFLAHLQQNWLVWVGGLALVIGAAYLIQVIGSNFSFPPLVRVFTAIIISLMLALLGEWTHRKIQAISHTFLNEKADAYIPATLYAAGMSGLYATTIFSTVIYQMVTPSLALIVMALLALLCLALTHRLGPLLCALGLFGGYSAPVWIGGAEPNYWLLTSYITIISIAGLLVCKKSRFLWVPTAICLAHSMWLALIAIQLPLSSLALWFALLMPISVYLLLLVPKTGWRLTLHHRSSAKLPYFHPLLPAILLSLVNGILCYRTWHNAAPTLTAYLLPSLLLILPIIRNRLTTRDFYGVTIIAIALGVATCGLISEQHQISSNWLLFGLFTMLVSLRTYSQWLYGDKHPIAYWLAVMVQPLLLIGGLVYLKHNHLAFLNHWAIFSFTLSLALLLSFTHYIKQFQQESSTALHAVVFTLLHCFIGSDWLALAIATQVVIATCQYCYRLYAPSSIAIKLLMTLLILRISLIPFIAQWQLTTLPMWSWLIAIFIPTLTMLFATQQLILKTHQELKEWFGAAMLHLLVIFIFAQSHYYLLGTYDFVSELDFYSSALFASQTIILAALYQYKQRIANQLKRFYQIYSAVLAFISALLMVSLNTIYQPLLNSYVLGSDWPIFNWLSIGWLIPASTLILATHYKLYSPPIKAIHLYGVAAALGSLWLIYSIRQFWQDGSLTLDNTTSMAEMLSYSVALIIIGALSTYYGAQHRQELLQRCGLIILGIAVCKVFLLDTPALEGLWRAVSFLGLGGSLVALGWLFQKLNYKTEQEITNKG